MVWLGNLLFEFIATFMFMFVIFPSVIILHIAVIVSVVILWPISLLAIKKDDGNLEQ